MSLQRDLFLSGMAATYLLAFSSLYAQIPGLYGERGLLPAHLVLQSWPRSWSEFIQQPSLLRFLPAFGFALGTAMDTLTIAGIIISSFALVFQCCRSAVCFASLWILYLSLFQVGQTFLWFQWDILLLEAGFLTIVVAPFWAFGRKVTSQTPQSLKVTMWLVKWLLFRLMFASGIVKLTSQCPTWWGLTALNYHYETQCIPTPAAWYFHQLPEWFQKLSVVATYFIEIALPVLFFSPIRFLRLLSFWAQVLLMILIFITGNYNFFNILTVVLCFSLLDDEFLGRKRRDQGSSFIKSTGKLVRLIVGFAVLAALVYGTIRLFSLQITNSTDFAINSKIAFSQGEFSSWLNKTVPLTITTAAVLLGIEIITALVRSFVYSKGFSRIFSLLKTGFYCSIAVCLFAVSLVPYARISSTAVDTLPRAARNGHRLAAQLRITSSYGLFRRMTGVGGRPELILEGAMSEKGPWKEYDFLYKPGKPSWRPTIVAPHQPRLDWQMWFAALGTYEHNPWLLNLCYRLLTHESDVLQLIVKPPFSKAPKFVRGRLYHYHFTKKLASSDWWTRQVAREYLPPLSLDDTNFMQYIRSNGLLKQGPEVPKPNGVAQSLIGIVQSIRSALQQPEGFNFVCGIFLASFLVRKLNRRLFHKNV